MKPIVIIEQDPPLVGGGLVQRLAEARGMPLRIVQAFDGGLAAIDLDDVSALVPMGAASTPGTTRTTPTSGTSGAC